MSNNYCIFLMLIFVSYFKASGVTVEPFADPYLLKTIFKLYETKARIIL